MTRKTIAQRELRNNVGAVLREAEAGTVFTVTVRGRPVAQLGPTGEPVSPRTELSREEIRRILALPLDGAAMAADLDQAEARLDDPWPDR
jgi:prevent-host-death family protein